MVQQQGLGEITDIAAKLAGIETSLDRGRINDGFASEIQDHCGGLDQLQRVVVDQMVGRLNRRYMKRDEIGSRQQRLQVFHPGHCVGQSPCRVDRQGRVETQDLHVKGQRHIGHH